MVMPMIKSRDNLGFIILDGIAEKMELVPNTHGTYSYIFDGDKYFYKRCKDVGQIYNELVGYELAKDFGIDAIEYDLASYNGFIGVTSKDYMKKDYVCLEDMLKSFYGTDKDKCTYVDVCEMLFTKYYELSSELMKDLLRLIMFDVIIGNSDRHDRNIIIDTSNLRLAPISDNELLLNSNALEKGYYSFSIDGEKDKTSYKLLNYLNNDDLELFKEKVKLIEREHILEIINRIEKKIGAPMVDFMKEKLLNDSAIHYMQLHKLLYRDNIFKLLFRKK